MPGSKPKSTPQSNPNLFLQKVQSVTDGVAGFFLGNSATPQTDLAAQSTPNLFQSVKEGVSGLIFGNVSAPALSEAESNQAFKNLLVQTYDENRKKLFGENHIAYELTENNLASPEFIEQLDDSQLLIISETLFELYDRALVNNPPVHRTPEQLNKMLVNILIAYISKVNRIEEASLDTKFKALLNKVMGTNVGLSLILHLQSNIQSKFESQDANKISIEELDAFIHNLVYFKAKYKQNRDSIGNELDNLEKTLKNITSARILKEYNDSNCKKIKKDIAFVENSLHLLNKEVNLLTYEQINARKTELEAHYKNLFELYTTYTDEIIRCSSSIENTFVYQYCSALDIHKLFIKITTMTISFNEQIAICALKENEVIDDLPTFIEKEKSDAAEHADELNENINLVATYSKQQHTTVDQFDTAIENFKKPKEKLTTALQSKKQTIDKLGDLSKVQNEDVKEYYNQLIAEIRNIEAQIKKINDNITQYTNSKQQLTATIETIKGKIKLLSKDNENLDINVKKFVSPNDQILYNNLTKFVNLINLIINSNQGTSHIPILEDIAQLTEDLNGRLVEEETKQLYEHIRKKNLTWDQSQIDKQLSRINQRFEDLPKNIRAYKKLELNGFEIAELINTIKELIKNFTLIVKRIEYAQKLEAERVAKQIEDQKKEQEKIAKAAEQERLAAIRAQQAEAEQKRLDAIIAQQAAAEQKFHVEEGKKEEAIGNCNPIVVQVENFESSYLEIPQTEEKKEVRKIEEARSLEVRINELFSRRNELNEPLVENGDLTYFDKLLNTLHKADLTTTRTLFTIERAEQVLQKLEKDIGLVSVASVPENTQQNEAAAQEGKKKTIGDKLNSFNKKYLEITKEMTELKKEYKSINNNIKMKEMEKAHKKVKTIYDELNNKQKYAIEDVRKIRKAMFLLQSIEKRLPYIKQDEIHFQKSSRNIVIGMGASGGLAAAGGVGIFGTLIGLGVAGIIATPPGLMAAAATAVVVLAAGVGVGAMTVTAMGASAVVNFVMQSAFFKSTPAPKPSQSLNINNASKEVKPVVAASQ